MKSTKRRAPPISRRVREQFAASTSLDGRSVEEDAKKKSRTNESNQQEDQPQAERSVAAVTPMAMVSSRPVQTNIQSEPDSVKSGSQLTQLRTPIRSVMMTINTATGRTLSSSVETPSPDESVLDNANDLVSKMTDGPTSNEWLDEVSNIQKEDETKRKLEKYIRGDFFDRCKFLSVQKINNWSSDPGAMCLKICKHLNVKEHRYEAFWNAYAKSVNKALNNRRNDVSNLIQKSFMGK